MNSNQPEGLDLDRNSRSIVMFVVLAYAVSWLLYGASYYWHIDFIAKNMGYIVMYAPGIACLVVSLVYRIKPSELGLKMCKRKYLLWGIAIPVFYLGLSYAIYWMLYPETSISDLQFEASFLIKLPIGIFFAFGEEIGWRGFLAPTMIARFGFVKASLFVGVIWGCWHSLSSVESYYYTGASVTFVLMTTALSFIMNYLLLEDGSIWPAVMVHTFHNHIVMVFDTFTVGANKAYIAGECGIVSTAIMIVIVVVLLLRRKKPAMAVTG